MTFRCRDVDCGHEHTASCFGGQNSLKTWSCCECNGPMYKSEVHTPVSGCSAVTGMGSLGPAGSAIDINDFDKQLKEKLESLDDTAATYNSKFSTELAAQKVANWKQEIDDLLGEDEGDGMADPYGTAGAGDRHCSGDDNAGKVSDAQQGNGPQSNKPNSLDLPSQRNEDGVLPDAKIKESWTFPLFSSGNRV